MRSSVQNFKATFFGQRGLSLTEFMIAGGIGVVLVAGGLYFGLRFTQTSSFETAKNELMLKMSRASRQFEIDFSNAIKVRGSEKLFPAVFSTDSPAGEEVLPREFFPTALSNDKVVMFSIHAKEFSAPLFDLTEVSCPKPPDLVQGGDNDSGRDDKGFGRMRYRASSKVDPRVNSDNCFEAEMPVARVNAVSGSSSTDPNIIHQFNAQRFLNAALQQADVFFASNLNFGFLIKKIEYTPPSGENDKGKLIFKIWLREPAALDLSGLKIQAVKSVIYRVSEANQLVRDVKQIGGPDQISTLLDRVQSFQVSYRFADRRHQIFGAEIDESGNMIPLEVPAEALRAPFYAPKEGAANRLAWTDISAAHVALRIYSENSFDKKLSQVSGNLSQLLVSQCDWLKISSKFHLSCKKNFVTAGADFESLLLEYQSEASSADCLPGDVMNRCRPTCSHVYVSQNRTDLDWEGYKNGSDYCICKGESQILPEQAAFQKPAFNSSDNTQLNTCIRAMASCSQASGSWARHDPRLYVACYGAKPDFRDVLLKFDDGQLVSEGTPWAENGQLNDEWQNLTSALSSLAAATPPTYQDLTQEEHESKRKLSCLDWPVVNRKAKQWASGYEDSYLNLCGCRLYEFNELGAPSATVISKFKLHWPTLCSCPNLFEQDDPDQDLDRRYKFRFSSADSNVDAFYLNEQATLCQCRQEDSSNDFRREGTLGRPPGDYFSGLSKDSKVATLDSLLVDVKILNLTNGESQEMMNQKCTYSQFFVNSYEWNLETGSTTVTTGGCAEAFSPEGTLNGEEVLINFEPFGAGEGETEGPVWENTSWPAEHPTRRREWSGYCRFTCDDPATRNRLLNRAPETSGSWPLWCGSNGQAGSGSYGQGGE